MSDDTIILSEHTAVLLHWPDEFVQQEMCSLCGYTIYGIPTLHRQSMKCVRVECEANERKENRMWEYCTLACTVPILGVRSSVVQSKQLPRQRRRWRLTTSIVSRQCQTYGWRMDVVMVTTNEEQRITHENITYKWNGNVAWLGCVQEQIQIVWIKYADTHTNIGANARTQFRLGERQQQQQQQQHIWPCKGTSAKAMGRRGEG